MVPGGRILAVTGLQREAKLVAGDRISAVIGAGDAKELERRLDMALERIPVVAMLSFGVCGALTADLAAGQLVIGRRVVSGDQSWTCDAEWTASLLARLPGAREAEVAAGKVMIGSVEAKTALAARSGCQVVDMESHIVAQAAQARGLPFAVVRAVSDRADHALPPAALLDLRDDGRPNLPAILGSLAHNPGQLPALIRTAKQAELAFKALERIGWPATSGRG